MKCQVCGNAEDVCDKKRKNAKQFHIQLRSNHGVCMTVPCCGRNSVNKLVVSTLPAKTNEMELYLFDLTKTATKIIISGVDNHKFLEHYDMKAYDRVFCEVKSHCSTIVITPEDSEGFMKERVAEPFVFEDVAEVIVVPDDMVLTGSAIARINRCVIERGLGLGVVFVHKMTFSDVYQKSMHIPKIIAEAVEIPGSGSATLVGGEEDVDKDAKFYTSTDGRIRFKSGFYEFVQANKNRPGKVVLMMVHKVDNSMTFSVDVVGS